MTADLAPTCPPEPCFQNLASGYSLPYKKSALWCIIGGEGISGLCNHIQCLNTEASMPVTAAHAAHTFPASLPCRLWLLEPTVCWSRLGPKVQAVIKPPEESLMACSLRSHWVLCFSETFDGKQNPSVIPSSCFIFFTAFHTV